MPYEIRWGPPPVLEGFTQFMLGRMGAKREAEKWEYEHRTPWGRIGGTAGGAGAGAAIGGILAAPTGGISVLGGALLGGGIGGYAGGEMGGAIFDQQPTAETIQGLRGIAGQTMDLGGRMAMQDRAIAAQQQAAQVHEEAMYSRMHFKDFKMSPEEMAAQHGQEIQAGTIPADTTIAQYRSRILPKRRLEMVGDEQLRQDEERYWLRETGGRHTYSSAKMQAPDDPMSVLMPARMEYQQQQQAMQMQRAQQVQHAQQVERALISLPQNSDESRELARTRHALVGANAGHYPGNPQEQAKPGLRRQMIQELRTAEQKVLEAAEAQQMTQEKRQQRHELSRGEDRDDAGNLIGWTYYNPDGSIARVSHPAALKREEEDKVIDIGNGVMMPESTYYKMIYDIAKLRVDFKKEELRGATARFEKYPPYDPATEIPAAVFAMQNLGMERARERVGPEIIAGPPEPGAPPQGMPPPGAGPPPAPAGEGAADWTAQAIEAIRAPLRQQLMGARQQGVVFNRAQAKTVMNQYYALAKQELGEDAAPSEIKRRAKAMLTADGGLPAVK